jgi:hypothetical protein
MLWQQQHALKAVKDNPPDFNKLVQLDTTAHAAQPLVQKHPSRSLVSFT